MASGWLLMLALGTAQTELALKTLDNVAADADDMPGDLGWDLPG